jgi:hypothetical protein
VDLLGQNDVRTCSLTTSEHQRTLFACVRVGSRDNEVVACEACFLDEATKFDEIKINQR